MTIFHLDRTPSMQAPRARERQTQSMISAALAVPGVLPNELFWTAIPGGDRQVTTTPGYRSGTPDFVFIYRGRTIWIELKREVGGVVSKVQKAVHELIERAGAQAYIAHNLHEVVDILRDDLKVPVRLRVQ